MRNLTIGNRVITQDSDAFVIAEIGHNHGGSIETALLMCKAAKECGCDAVKLQKRSNRRIYTKKYLARAYNSENAFGPTYGDHREFLEFGRPEYTELKAYCDEIGILLFATAFDEGSADFLEHIDVPAYKIASGDLVNTPLIQHVAKKGKPVIISTGGGSWPDIERADEALGYAWGAFLHCVCIYPCPPEKATLQAIEEMVDRYHHRIIGYSCHVNGIWPAGPAYLYGARIIEKHFTLDHTAKGSDHAYSLQPEGMRKMVRDLRNIREAQGTGTKYRRAEEDKALEKMEKVCWPATTLPRGHILEPEDIVVKSPSVPNGLRPYKIVEILGKALKNDCSTSQPFYVEDIYGEE